MLYQFKDYEQNSFAWKERILLDFWKNSLIHLLVGFCCDLSFCCLIVFFVVHAFSKILFCQCFRILQFFNKIYPKTSLFNRLRNKYIERVLFLFAHRKSRPCKFGLASCNMLNGQCHFDYFWLVIIGMRSSNWHYTFNLSKDILSGTAAAFLNDYIFTSCFFHIFSLQSVFISGYGIFTEIPFKKNDFLIEYQGELISSEKGECRAATYENVGSYLFFYEKWW